MSFIESASPVTIRIRRIDLFAAVGLGVLFGLGSGLLFATPDRSEISSPADILPACVTEDTRNCFWDADKAGNRVGTDFIDVAGVVYLRQP